MKRFYLFKIFLLACIFGMTGTNAVAQTTVTDVLTADMFKATSTSYTSFSDVTATSDAVYAGYNAKHSSGAIQLRSSSSNSGIVTTTTGGKVRKITVEWNSNTSASRKLSVYGRNSAYTSATELYDTADDKIATLSYNASGATAEITGDYTYFGIRSASGAQYVSKITIEWEVEDGATPAVAKPTFTPADGTVFDGTQTVSIISETEGATIYYTTDNSDPTTSSTKYTAPFTISETTIVKAIAVKEGMEDSNIAAAVYTKTTTLNGLSELSAAILADNSSSSKTYLANLTGAVVTCVSGSNAYIEEGETGMFIFIPSHGLNVGDVLSGNVTVSGCMYSGAIPELTAIEGATINTGGTLPLTEVTLAQLVADKDKYMSRRVKVVDATATTATSSKNTTIEQDGTSLVLRDNSGTLALAVNDKINVVAFVSYYSSKVQLAIYSADAVEVVGGLETPTFAFSDSEFFVELGETFTAPTLTNNSDGVVSYESSNEAVATVASNGAVTILGKGTTVIKASVTETATYAAAEASYTLTVTEPGVKPDQYVLVTSPLQLVPGDKYLIASNSEGFALGVSSSNGKYRTHVAATFSADKTSITALGEAVELTLGGTAGAWTFFDGEGYLSANSSKNELHTKDAVDEYAEANIYINTQDDVRITFNAGSSTLIRYNNTSPRFSCYSKTSGKNVQLYHKVIDEKENLYTVLTAEEGGVYYGTAYYDRAYIVPAGLEAGIITDAAANGVLTVDYRYTEGTTIPAKTAVLFKGTTTAQTFVVAEDAGTPPENNLLHGVDAIDSNGMTYAGENYKYYILAFNKDTGADLGFYYGAADGGAIAYKAPYAFLAIPESIALGVKGFRFSGQATAIESAVQTAGKACAPIFDLSGRRVQNATKGGIYIQNGKKFIVK